MRGERTATPAFRPESILESQRQAARPHSPESIAPSGHKSFLEDIAVEYGPEAQLRQLFLSADTELRSKGVFLSFAGLDELVALNEANPKTWNPILPIFRPDIGGADADNAYALIGRDSSGEPVATIAGRRFDWHGTNFAREAESLRLFYAEPDRDKKPGEECHVNAPSAYDLTGTVVFSGAVWYRPDFRRRGITTPLGHISRGYALTRWDPGYTFSIMAEGVERDGLAKRINYPHIDYEVNLIKSTVGTVRCALIWTTKLEFIACMEAFLSARLAQVDARIEHGRAEQERPAFPLR